MLTDQVWPRYKQLAKRKLDRLSDAEASTNENWKCAFLPNHLFSLINTFTGVEDSNGINSEAFDSYCADLTVIKNIRKQIGRKQDMNIISKINKRLEGMKDTASGKVTLSSQSTYRNGLNNNH